MTRLEKLRRDIMESDEKAIEAIYDLLGYSDYIFEDVTCEGCEYECLGGCLRSFWPEGFVCPRPSERTAVSEFLNEEP